MIIRMIAMTISNSISENPRRFRILNICSLNSMTLQTPIAFSCRADHRFPRSASSALLAHQCVNGLKLLPEVRQQVQPQSVRTVGEGVLGLVVDFHKDAVHSHGNGGAGQWLDELRLAARSAAG